ncbi:MAG: tRNA guanosine(34) transglycosylase Tgt [Candidatus Baltobacteraceae bacterium]
MSGFELLARSGSARRARLTLAHGVVETPAFMPVGTAATVKGLQPRDLRESGTQILLANAYHLRLRPGRETILAAGGLHRFMAWDAPILTDSGGFQVFSLQDRRKLDPDGVTFKSHLDGSTHRFTPEDTVEFQEAIGVDIAMQLDVCVKLPASAEELEAAVTMTTSWAQRGAQARRASERTRLFAIVQGGLDERLRERSARELVALDLPGYAIGGLSVGETRDEMERMARFTAELLPAEKPRYIMGIGTVADIVVAVDCGIDMFDCVYPTRCGRNARAMTRTGEFNIRNAAYIRDFSPVDPRCTCMVCSTYTRAYLCHLFRAGEMLGPQLLSYHNVALLHGLMAEARAAIERDAWAAWRDALFAELTRSR